MSLNPQIKTLTNGLRYVVVEMPQVKSATVLALVKAGTRYEAVHTNGVSHFLEHAVSKGTAQYPTAMDLSLAVDMIGGKNNAFTSKELTGYFVKSAAEDLEVGLKVVSELMFHPRLPEAEINIERGVILEEIRMYEDDPQAKIARIFEEVLFEPTTLGWPTLGTPQTIQQLSRDTLSEYCQYMYTPNRIVLMIVGGVTAQPKGKSKPGKPLETLIEQYFGVARPHTIFQEEVFEFKQTHPKLKVVPKDTEQCHAVFGYRTFGRGHQDRYVLSVLATILGGGMSSRLFTEIREKRGLAYYVGAYPQIYTESGYLAMCAGSKPESTAEVIKLAEAEFMHLSEKKVTTSELSKAKAFIKGHLTLGWEDSLEIAEFYGEDLIEDDRLRSLDEVIEGVNTVTSEDIQRLSKQLFVDKGKNLAVIGPGKWVEKIGI